MLVRQCGQWFLVFCVSSFLAVNPIDSSASSNPRNGAQGESSAPSRPVTLTEYLIDATLRGPSGLDVRDIDGDGHVDVVATGYADNQVAWWRNAGGEPPTWTKQVVGNQFDGAIDVVAGDIDGDLDIDLAGAAWYGHQVAWWENTGGEPISWIRHVLGSDQTNAHEVCVHDVDGDLDADIVAAIAGTNSIMLWVNDGGQWAAQTLATGFGGARSVFVCDLDDDGDADVLGAALDGNRVTWWRNDGGSPLQWTELDISTNYGGAHQVSACDMDGDGDLDVLAAGYVSPTLCWWRNDGGDPLLWSLQTIGTFPGAVMAYAGDLDDDGLPDVVATAQNPSDVVWWHNDGGDPLGWTRHTIDDNFEGVWPLSLGDVNGDGTTDIVAGGSSANELRWWKNHPIWLMPAFSALPTTGHAPVQIQFTDQTLAWPPVVSWAWDLDGDGVVDSNDQNPSWLYEQPGSYSITLTAVSDSLNAVCTRVDYVRVFDGESALQFNASTSAVTCASAPSL
ncbi:MAG: FG-GAP-like repeat-containing protein, partial [Candidatus Eisenbacteria bacterium]|nr:FG-GAP-like repeat-containing protein [Candidatus Eisenbacteria bacterium]